MTTQIEQTTHEEVPTTFSDWREYRRYRAWELHEAGWTQTEIAEALGVTGGAVSQWFKKVREEGLGALQSQPDGGPKPRLTEAELQQLPAFLEQGAEAYGFRGAVWTRARVGEVIAQEFGVHYSDSHVGRLLAQIGWTLQKPVEQADRRDEAQITCWCEETFPALKKKAAAEDRTLVFIDEAAFYLLPGAVRTYAPRGETPVLRYRYWEHRSAISAITPDGQLYTWTQTSSFNGPAIVRFLKHVDRHIPGKLLVIWDGLPAHRSQAVKDYLRDQEDCHVYLAQLPGYAPDLNPDEGVWQYLKHVELKNVCCHSLSELHTELRKAIKRLRRKPDVIQGFVRQVYPDLAL